MNRRTQRTPTDTISRTNLHGRLLQYSFRDHPCTPALTNRMWAHGICVHSEEWHCNEGSVAPEAQDGVAQLECGLMLVCITLVEVDV